MVNKGRKMSEFEDGTSKTAAVSELLTIPGTDTRGTLHFGAASMYMHDYLPNHVDTSSIQVDQTRWCVTTDVAPCRITNEEWRGEWKHTARSAHPGGVNLMLVDTSVRFVSESVSLETWQAYSTPRGGEVTAESL